MHGLLRCNISTGVRARALARNERVTQRCHSSLRWKTGLQSANNVTQRKRAEDFENLKKVRELRLDTGRERLTFACSQRPWAGVTRDGGGAAEKARIEKFCLSLLMSKNL